MAAEATPLQRKATEAIMARIQQYLDVRYAHLRRMNPKAELVWEDITWQQTTVLRRSLNGEKAFGPDRYHVAELLLSDDQRRMKELFSHKSQNCLLGEIVEEKEKETHRTAGTAEIHDMRTFFRSVDPTLETMVALVQTYIWWDLEDAADTARFEKKLNLVRAFAEKGVTGEIATYYQSLMGADRAPGAEEIVKHEIGMMGRCLDYLRARRETERGYMMVVAREVTAQENPDVLMEALGSQIGLLNVLLRGGSLDETMIGQFARAMGCEPGLVSPEKARHFLETTVASNRKRLKNAFAGGGGAPYNFKLRQLDDLQKRLAELAAERNIEQPAPQPIPTSAG